MILDFKKGNGLIPVIVQHSATLQVLMLGYMNEEALTVTKETGKITFFSRSKKRLWTKGEQSGHTLTLDEILQDCDNDTLLIKATPKGPTCHTGAKSCFKEVTSKGFIYALEQTIHERVTGNSDQSYTAELYQKGINKIAQKVGEEAVELIIEAKDNNIALFKNEAADLLYHYLLLLKAKGIDLQQIEEVLEKRSS
jgi:phosphoribosyl-AMP cyclohydrolase / phosphoribosyl-ATP pyrophosphohydrolase